MIIIIFLKFMNARGIRLKIGIKEIKNRTFKSAIIFNSVFYGNIYSTPTITEVALMIAYASLPTSKFNSLTAAKDTVEESTLPPPISM